MSGRRRNLEPVPEEFRPRPGEERLLLPKGTLLSEVEKEDVVWLWESRIPRGKITILDGDPGLGKSAVTTDLAARVSVGRPFPDGTDCPEGGVVLMNAEDGLADTIRPRLDAAGGDPSRVLALAEIPDESRPDQDRVLSLPEDLRTIEEGIERVGAVLLLIDPLMAFLGGDTNAHKDQDIRRALASLKSMAERTGVAVVLVRHLNKGGGGNPLYRGGGSIGIIGAARSGLIVAQDPNDPEGKRRVLAGSKNNLAQMEESTSFQVVTAVNGAARVEWLGQSDLSATDLVKTPLDDEEKSALDEAVEFLREELRGKPISARTIYKNAKDAGVSERTLKRAKSNLKVNSEKEADGSWSWALPDEDPDNESDNTGQGGQGANTRTLGTLAKGAKSGNEDSLYLSEGGQGGQGCQGIENKQLQENVGTLDLEPDDWRNHPMDCECSECL